ncbi:GNAT family protein [Arthrobacter sp. LAPM80]|uniref:GNAT family N-acetyltransferase n=1 Tax=Arthrobacter sp. LAPM80 TaxID=3141788 RepID=UPI00398B6762
MTAGRHSGPDPVLVDGAVSLRRFTAVDAPAFAAIHSDPLNVLWSGSVADMDPARAVDFIEGSIAAGWDNGSSLRFAIVQRMAGAKTGEVVGTLSLQDLFRTPKGGSASVGIKMLPAGRGTGSAGRAIRLLCDYAYGTLGLEILHWRCTSGNLGSVSLAGRCGFVLAAEIPGFGHVGGEVADGLMFTQSARQWAGRDKLTGQDSHDTDGSRQGHSRGTNLDPTPVVPVLRGPTVVLRAPAMADAGQLVEICRDPESVRWTTIPLDYTMDHAIDFIKNITPKGWRTGETLTFAVAHAETDTLLGTVDLQCPNPGTAAVGINIGAGNRGTGTAEAAARLLLDYAFNQLNLAYVHWHALVPNWGSRKLAWKLGFTFDGQLRGDYNDRGTPADRWVLSLAAGEEHAPREPWTGPAPLSR